MARRNHRRSEGWRTWDVEMAVGIGLVVISAVLIIGIVRVVGNNLGVR